VNKTVKLGIKLFAIGVVVMIAAGVIVRMPAAIMHWLSLTDIPAMVIGWYIAYVVMFAAAAVSVTGLVVAAIGGILSIINRHRARERTGQE